MNSNSWGLLFLVVVGYISVICFFFVMGIILRKGIDIAEKKYQSHLDSVDIIDEIELNSNNCNIDTLFEDLERNKIDISCNYSIE